MRSVSPPAEPTPAASSASHGEPERLRARLERLEAALAAERETAAELRALDEARNAFLAAVSHDLRTPLAAILGLALTLEQHELDRGEVKDLAARIASNARRLDRMVADLLDLDRLSRGLLEPVPRPVELGALVEAVVADSDVVGDRAVSVAVAEAPIEGDAPMIERVVENLLANAARHTPPGSRIWVSAGPDGDGGLIAVEDDGPGVDPAQRRAVFEPFRRPGAGQDTPGVGVGLAVVARFAELHGGRAWVEDREGGGASFRVWLPSRSAAPPPGS
jgi:signal transduction histidine kinase